MLLRMKNQFLPAFLPCIPFKTQRRRVHIVEGACTSRNRPVWFLFSGIGSQWPGMGRELLRFDTFRESIQKSKLTLKNVGVDLDKILGSNSTHCGENIRENLNAIAAIQIALYDLSVSVGIVPDCFIGHSTGEILCAYADKCLSAEETLLIMDACGRAITETQTSKTAKGSMINVKLSWKEISKYYTCPPEIVAACHNGPNHTTLAGPQKIMKKFVLQLEAKNAFPRNIKSCGVALHSPLINEATGLYLKYIREIYKGCKINEQTMQTYTYKIRSSKWISTCLQSEKSQCQLKTPLAVAISQTVSPEYFIHNLTNPVFFYEALRQIPPNAIMIEIAPQGLMCKMLKSRMGGSVFAPMERDSNDRLKHFISCVGDIIASGIALNDLTLFKWNNLLDNAMNRNNDNRNSTGKSMESFKFSW